MNINPSGIEYTDDVRLAKAAASNLERDVSRQPNLPVASMDFAVSTPCLTVDSALC